MRHNWQILQMVLLGLVLWNGPLAAQLSPGDLSRAHSAQEGLRNCTTCHSAGRQIDPANCLSCHKILKERIDSSLGLHARKEFADCITCHSEHHGREFQLIHWPDGMEKFDHRKTGFELLGAHRAVDCRSCHQPEHISDKNRFQEEKRDLQKTFLGLDRNCLSCHRDEHRGQFQAKNCLDCHSMESWQPAAEFDHNRQARFKLDGRHLKLDCLQCHTTTVDNMFSDDGSFIKFRGIAFAQCSSCHNDAHQGRLGKDCATCHQTSGWKNIRGGSAFNHDLTRFPLEGRHSALACESCHKPGAPSRAMAFENCLDCHSDFHEGQFSDRLGQGACESCHSVEGFRPSSFSVEDHQQSDFPLQGAHLAIPCEVCHRQRLVELPELQPITTRSMLPINRFSIKAENCYDCHQNPHDRTVEPFVKKADCLACHNIDTWREIDFDHAATGFALAGKHQALDCLSCHQPDQTPPDKKVTFAGQQADCATCHEDVHRGQFAGAGNTTDCAVCHSPAGWQQLSFDHNRQSRFKLEGAHATLDCYACHKKEAAPDSNSDQMLVRFKPMEMECRSCHG